MGMPPRGSASGAGTAASTPGGIHASGTPGSAMFGMAAFGQGLGPEQVGVYALGPGPMGQYPYHVAAQHQHMATVMQLQAEVERLQVRTKCLQLGLNKRRLVALVPWIYGPDLVLTSAMHSSTASADLALRCAWLQVAMVQAQSRQRLAEQRASDAEQLSSELQVGCG